jgi:hypothetical protein
MKAVEDILAEAIDEEIKMAEQVKAQGSALYAVTALEAAQAGYWDEAKELIADLLERVELPSVHRLLQKVMASIEAGIYHEALEYLSQAAIRLAISRRSTLKIFDSGQQPYWVAISSGAYLDRAGEVVSQEALDAAVKEMDERGDYGPLCLYHLYPVAKVGTCLVSARIGKFLVEAGTWDDTPLARAARDWVERNPYRAAVSIGFTYDPDKFDGMVYRKISILERSLISAEHSAFPWSSLKTKEVAMADIKRLAEIVGPELAEEVRREAESLTDELDRLGVVSKSVESEEQEAAPAELTEKAAEGESYPAPAAEGEGYPPPYGYAEGYAEGLSEDDLAKIVQQVSAQLQPVLDKVAEQLQDIADRLSELEKRVDALEKEKQAEASDVAEVRAILKALGRQPRAIRITESSGLEPAQVEEPDAEERARQRSKGLMSVSELFNMTFEDSLLRSRR